MKVFLTQQIPVPVVTKLPKILYEMFIQDPEFFSIPDPTPGSGSRIQGPKTLDPGSATLVELQIIIGQDLGAPKAYGSSGFRSKTLDNRLGFAKT
jgi:hypothetical protein